MHTYQRHTAASALPRPEHDPRIIHLPSCRKKKFRSSTEIWNVIFSVLVVALAVCVFVR